MTKCELLVYLEGMPDDWEVVASSDAEGNTFSPICDVYGGFYLAKNTWRGGV